MEFVVDERNVYRLLLGFLEERGMFDTLIQLSLESGVSVTETEEELLYLQDLVLTGRWIDVMWYLQPMKNVVDFQLIEYIVLKQNFLESLAFIGYGGDMAYTNFPAKTYERSHNGNESKSDIDSPELEKHMNGVVSMLNLLESLCPSTKEYNSLCYCLTLESVTENPDFSTWSVSQGRWKCLGMLREVLSKGQKQPAVSEAGAGRNPFLDIVGAGLSFYQQSLRGVGSEAGKGREFHSTTWVPHGGGLLPQDYRDHINQSAGNVANAGGMQLVKKVRRRIFYGGAVDTNANNTEGTEDEYVPGAGHAGAMSVSIADISGGENRRNEESLSVEEQGASPSNRHTHQHEQQQHPSHTSNHPIGRLAVQNPVAWTAGGDGDSSQVEEKKHSSPPARLQRNRHTHTHADSKERRGDHTEGARKHDQRHQQYYGRGRNEHKGDGDAYQGPSSSHHSSPKNRGTAGTAHDTADGSPTRGNRTRDPTMQRDNNTGPAHLTRDSLSGPDSYSHISNDHHNAQPPNLSTPFLLDWENEYLRSFASVNPSSQQGTMEIAATPELLYHSKSPLRCVSWMEQSEDDESRDISPYSAFTFAVGSNAKSLKVSQLVTTYESGRYNKGVSELEVKSEWANVHTGSVYCCDWSPSQQLMASGSNDKSLRICNVRTGRMNAPMKGHVATIRSVAFQPSVSGASNQLHVASAGGGDNQPRVWDVQTGQCSSLTGHSDSVHGLTWLTCCRDSHFNTPSDDKFSNVLVSGCEKGLLIAHDIRMRSPAWSMSLPSNRGICSMSCACDAAGRPMVVAGCTEGFVSAVDMTDRREVVSQQVHMDDVRAVSVISSPCYDAGSSHNSYNSADTDLCFVTTSFDKTAAVWSIPSPNLYSSDTPLSKVASLGSHAASIGGGDVGPLAGHTDKVLGVDTIVHRPFPHSNIRRTSIITTGADGRVLLWRVPVARSSTDKGHGPL